MDIFLLVVAFLFLALSFVGSIIPGLPGVPLAFIGLLIAQATERVDFSWQVLLIYGIVTVVVQVLDYIVPAWGTKKYGGTKWGVIGSIIGVFAGMGFGFVGVIVGPLVGAVLGELLQGKALQEAVKAGWGSFIGILFGVIIKLISCGVMTVALIQAL